MAYYIEHSSLVTLSAFPKWIVGAQRGGGESDRQYCRVYTAFPPMIIRICPLSVALQGGVRARLGCFVSLLQSRKTYV